MSRLTGLAVLLGPVVDASTEAVLRRLVSEGARVALAAPDSSARNQLVDSTGPNVVAVDLVPGDETSWRGAVDGAVVAFGGLHAVIECRLDPAHGADQAGPSALTFVAEVALPHLTAAGGGAMVAVHLPAASSPLVDDIDALVELGERGVRCMAVRADPSSTQSILSDGDRPRCVTPGDVAGMVAFLLSDDAATCSGVTFDVSAGVTW